MTTPPLGVWAVAGTPITAPYPCRCSERPEWARECSPAWCPCAGREDPPNAQCCGTWTTPADHVEAMAAWRIKRMQQDA